MRRVLAFTIFAAFAVSCIGCGVPKSVRDQRARAAKEKARIAAQSKQAPQAPQAKPAATPSPAEPKQEQPAEPTSEPIQPADVPIELDVDADYAYRLAQLDAGTAAPSESSVSDFDEAWKLAVSLYPMNTERQIHDAVLAIHERKQLFPALSAYSSLSMLTDAATDAELMVVLDDYETTVNTQTADGAERIPTTTVSKTTSSGVGVVATKNVRSVRLVAGELCAYLDDLYWAPIVAAQQATEEQQRQTAERIAANREAARARGQAKNQARQQAAAARQTQHQAVQNRASADGAQRRDAFLRAHGLR